MPTPRVCWTGQGVIGRAKDGEALVRDPLSPLLKVSGPDYERFKASRSMRDVEHVSSVEILDPFGKALT
jgi:hypothetical protein